MARKNTERRREGEDTREEIRDISEDNDDHNDEGNSERWKKKEGFEIYEVESEDEENGTLALDREPPLDDTVIDAETNAKVVMDEIDDFTSDEEVQEDFKDRQLLNAGGSEELDHRLREYTGESPDLSADDIDARWEAADQSGEESAGGSNPTPDQDVVEELGEAFGIDYDEDEPLHTEEKLEDRDINRWELDPNSAQPEEEDLIELEDEDELDQEDVELYLEDLLEAEEAEEEDEEDYYQYDEEDEDRDFEEDEFDDEDKGYDEDEEEDGEDDEDEDLDDFDLDHDD